MSAPKMSQSPKPTLRGFSHVVNPDQSVTITKAGSAVSREFADWHAGQSEAVQHLVRLWQEGKRGKAYPLEDAPFRPVTRTSITIDPATFTLAQAQSVALGPFDAEPVVNT